MEELNSRKDINYELAQSLTLALLDGFVNLDKKEWLTYLLGMSIGLVSCVQIAKEDVEAISDKDGFEKLVLKWIATASEKYGLSFNKFISLHEDEKKSE